jgi:bleomycin hydrolase
LGTKKLAMDLTDDLLSALATETRDDALLRHALRNAPLSAVAFDADAFGRLPRHAPCVQTRTKLPAVNQHNSGRCWIMAGLNLLRHTSAPRLGREKDFELSGAFVLFWDKLEKAALFLHHVRSLLHVHIEDRELQHLLAAPVSDGGQFSMFVDLVERHGCVPVEAMPDSVHATNTKELNAALNDLLRFYAERLRSTRRQQHDALVRQALGLVYRLLAATLGAPPTTVPNLRGPRLTPLEYYHALVPADLRDYVTLISVERPCGAYEVAYLGSMVGGRPVRYLNVPFETMLKATTDALDLGTRVWFGSDVQYCLHRTHGLLDPGVFDWALVLGVDVDLPRGKRLLYHQSSVTHAMVFSGYRNDEAGRLVSFAVENSWGPEVKKGYLDMHKDWARLGLWEVAVPRSVLAPELLQTWDAPGATRLPPWDPIAALLGSCCTE